MSDVAWSVCLHVGHTGELRKNGGTSRDDIWDEVTRLTWAQGGPYSRTGKGNFKGMKGPAHCRERECSCAVCSAGIVH